MALKSKVSADLIRASDLAPAVENAIKLAEAKIGAVVTGENFHVPKWEIVGRYARNLATAQQFADEVTKNINEKFAGGGGVTTRSLTARTRVVPAVVKFDRFLIAGFIERINIPVVRGL